MNRALRNGCCCDKPRWRGRALQRGLEDGQGKARCWEGAVWGAGKECGVVVGEEGGR